MTPRMLVVYHCWSGSCLAPVAAAIHLGILPAAGRPLPREIAACPYFGALRPDDVGFLHPCGLDSQGHQVFVTGNAGSAALVEAAARAGAELTGRDKDTLTFHDCVRAVGIAWAALGYAWQGWSEGGAGRLALAWFILRRYHRLAGLVASVRAGISP